MSLEHFFFLRGLRDDLAVFLLDDRAVSGPLVSQAWLLPLLRSLEEAEVSLWCVDTLVI